jgi:hypothetical protein
MAASDSDAPAGSRIDAPLGTRLRSRTPVLRTRRSRYSPGSTRISVPMSARAIADAIALPGATAITVEATGTGAGPVGNERKSSLA